jgi:hypothetical protein
MIGESSMRRQFGLMIAAAAAAFAFTSPAHANPFTVSCGTQTSTLIICTFTGTGSELFVDGQSADINLSPTSNVTLAGLSQTISGGAATSSTFEIDSTNPVDGLGHFRIVDNLVGTPPTASSITITITGTNLALAPNEFGNIFAGHICPVSNGTNCTSPTVFAVPTPIVGAGLPGLVMACGGLLALARRRRQKIV